MAPSHMSREFDAGEVLGRGTLVRASAVARCACAFAASGACNGDGFASVDAAAASAATTALAAVASVVRVCLAASASAVALARALDASSDAFCALAFASAAAAAAAFPSGDLGHTDFAAMARRSASLPTDTRAYPTGGHCQKVAEASWSSSQSRAAATASFTLDFRSHPRTSGPRSSSAPTTNTFPTFSMPCAAQVYM